MQSLCSHYLACHALAPSTAAEYRTAAGHWGEFFGNRVISRIGPEDLAAFTVHLFDGRSAATVNKIRRHCLALLAWAVEVGRLKAVPRWRRLPEPRRAPKAFLAEEFRPILQVARIWPGRISGIPAGLWWGSLLLSTWYTGARIGALLETAWGDVLFDQGMLRLRAEVQKQRADQMFTLGDDALAMLQKVREPARVMVWSHDCCRKTLYRHFRRMAALAGVSLDHDRAGPCFHRIRRSTASYMEAGGGNATRHLGHSSSSVTRCYLDPRITGCLDSTRMMPRVA